MKYYKRICILLCATLICFQGCTFEHIKSELIGQWFFNEGHNFLIMSFEDEKVEITYINNYQVDPTKLKSVTLSWEISNDTVFLTNYDTKDCFALLKIYNDSVVFEGRNENLLFERKERIYKALKSEVIIDKKMVQRALLNSTFNAKSIIHDTPDQIDFLTDNKYILYKKEGLIQISNWKLIEQKDKIILLLFSPFGITACDLSSIENNNYVFNFLKNDWNNLKLNRITKNDSVESFILGKWSNSYDNLNADVPPSPCEEELFAGFYYEFNPDGSYLYKTRCNSKKGLWKFNSASNIILLDSIKIRKDLVLISGKIDSIFIYESLTDFEKEYIPLVREK